VNEKTDCGFMLAFFQFEIITSMVHASHIGAIKMQCNIGGHQLELVEGDITQQAVDAVVNAANSSLSGGGGVDGAIHRVGGPSIMQETARRYPEGCPTGSAVLTGAGTLPARYVIHAVGPVWSGGQRGEDRLLASTYRAVLKLASKVECTRIALPSLSTGAYRFPIVRASRIAIGTARKFLLEQGPSEQDEPMLVRFVLFTADVYHGFKEALDLS
jgi:O-acetyl-ADP-ribose deacetylase (regulator of RNase III)